jgi:hypothetical protein
VLWNIGHVDTAQPNNKAPVIQRDLSDFDVSPEIIDFLRKTVDHRKERWCLNFL